MKSFTLSDNAQKNGIGPYGSLRVSSDGVFFKTNTSREQLEWSSVASCAAERADGRVRVQIIKSSGGEVNFYFDSSREIAEIKRVILDAQGVSKLDSETLSFDGLSQQKLSAPATSTVFLSNSDSVASTFIVLAWFVLFGGVIAAFLAGYHATHFSNGGQSYAVSHGAVQLYLAAFLPLLVITSVCAATLSFFGHVLRHLRAIAQLLAKK
jgi:hypothetical protein